MLNAFLLHYLKLHNGVLKTPASHPLFALTMKHLQTEMEAIVVNEPSIRTVLNPATLEEDEHLAYDAEIQYKRKPPTVRMIMCSSLDDVVVGEPVMITYHCGMRCYKHSRHVVVSSTANTIGDFYFTDGTKA